MRVKSKWVREREVGVLTSTGGPRECRVIFECAGPRAEVSLPLSRVLCACSIGGALEVGVSNSL